LSFIGWPPCHERSKLKTPAKFGGRMQKVWR
jgi:hypothetical protein